MTFRVKRTRFPDHRVRSRVACLGCLGCAVALAGLAGCGSEEPAPPPVAKVTQAPKPVTPPKARVRSIDDLMAELRIDDRISFNEADAPASNDDRIAILEFFDGFARGDHASVGEMMTLADRMELADMVESGAWEGAVAGLMSIQIRQTGTSENGPCVIAVLTEDFTTFQPQLWYYDKSGEEYTFEAAPCPPDMINKLTGTDWITAWHDVLEEERQLALKPDERPEIPQVNLDENEGSRGSNAGRSPSSPRPAGPGVPGRRPPPKRKRRPPGPR